MKEPYRTMSALLGYAWFMYFIKIKTRTSMEVRKRFSKSNIKKSKKGFLNRLIYLNFHKKRPLGIWFRLNCISLLCVLVPTALFPLFYYFDFNVKVYIVILTLGYLFVMSVSLVANVKTKEAAFKSKGASVFSTNMSIAIYSIVMPAFFIILFFHLFYTYVV